MLSKFFRYFFFLSKKYAIIWILGFVSTLILYKFKSCCVQLLGHYPSLSCLLHCTEESTLCNGHSFSYYNRGKDIRYLLISSMLMLDGKFQLCFLCVIVLFKRSTCFAVLTGLCSSEYAHKHFQRNTLLLFFVLILVF